MREDQLQSTTYLAHIKDEIERAQKELQNTRGLNYRLQLEQAKNIDTLNKNSDNYKSDDTIGLKQIKLIKEDIQRVNLQMFDKERGIEGYVEKAAVFRDKVARLREKGDKLKDELGEHSVAEFGPSKSSFTPYNERNSIDNSIASSPRTMMAAKKGKASKYTDDDFKEDRPDKDLYTMNLKQLTELITASQKKLAHERCIFNVNQNVMKQKVQKNAKTIHELQETLKYQGHKLKNLVA